MADNTTLPVGAGGDVISTDDIGGGVKVQRVKVQFGVDGVATDVSASAGLPVDIKAAASLTVTGPLTDTELRATAVPVSLASVPSHAVTVTSGTLIVTQATGTNLHVVVDSGTVAATQSGTWNITNVSGTVSLPTGAATAANQLPDGHNVTVDNAAGVAAVNIQDGGNIITVDGTVGVSGTVTVAGTITIGSEKVDNFPFTDGASRVSVNGHVYKTSAPTAHADGDAGYSRIDDKCAIISVIEDGTTQGRIATVTAANALKVDGSGVTQPVSLASVPSHAVTGPLTNTELRATAVPVSGTVTVTGVATETTLAAMSAKLPAALVGGRLDVVVGAALPAGTNAIGKLAANSGVDIGDVDILSIAAGDNNIGNVDVVTLPALPTGTNTIGNVGNVAVATGGATPFHLISAATTNATSVKASAGKLMGWYIYNSNAAARAVKFHNTAGTPTAGSGVVFSIMLPGGAAANMSSESGIAFGTGIGITTVTEIADSGTTAVAASDLTINLWYA